MRCRSQGLPDRKAASTCACARLATPGRGRRPGHSAKLRSGPAGGQSPRPAPAPPPAGASPPPGRALASVVPGPAGPQGTVARGRRKRRSRFLIPPAGSEALSPLQWQGPSPLPLRQTGIRTSRGPKAPGQRPPRLRRALCTRRAGRWPCVVPGPAGLQGTVARGRGKRGSRFLFPPGQAKGPSTLQWQGPSPLPQRPAAP